MAKIQTWWRGLDAWTRALAEQLVAKPAPIAVRVERTEDRHAVRRRPVRRG